MVKVGKDLVKATSGPILLQVYLELPVQDHVQMTYEYLKGWRLHWVACTRALVPLTISYRKISHHMYLYTVIINLASIRPVVKSVQHIAFSEGF